MAPREFVSRLEHVTKTPRGWTARCPGHDDKQNSLSVGEGKDSRILLNCFAGCTPEAIVRALGLTMADLFADSAGGKDGKQVATTRATIEALARMKKLPVDFLRDEMGLRNQSNGVLVPYYQPDGSPAPRQRIRRTLEHGEKWCLWTTSPGEILPYGLELLSLAQDRTIILVEGESDCWTLRHHGFAALGIPGADMVGALKGEHLAGISRLFIVQETDAAGVNFVRNMLARLKEIGYAGELRIVSLAPHKDVSELHCADPEKFKTVFQGALDAAVDAAKWATPKSRTVWDDASFVSEEENEAPVDFLEEPVLARGCLTEISGPRGLGKSNYARWVAVKLARAGKRVLYLDRDNPPHKARQALRDWGGTRIVRCLARDKVPALLGNGADWKAFPVQDYDLVILDSWDSTAEGAGEKDSRLPSIAISHILDIVHAENGPAVLVLMNTVRDGTHSRCSGVVEDRADAVFEVRDITGVQFSGPKPWWEEMPIMGAGDWAARATRRKDRECYRMALVPSKFKLGGPEPSPFAVEIDFRTSPFSIRDVTDQIDREGAESRQRKAVEEAEAIQKAVDALTAEIQRRSEAGEPAILKKQAEDLLTHLAGLSVTQRVAREAIESEAFQLVDVKGKGRPKTVHLAVKKEENNRNNGVAEGAKTLGENGIDFGCPPSIYPTEIDPIQTRDKCGPERPPISVEDSLFTPPSGMKSDADEEVI
jgi:hypothetical protein